jgi:hypothetical protein
MVSDAGFCNQRMPVIRRADHDGVDVLVRQQLAVVRVAGHAVVRLARDLGVMPVDERLGIGHAFGVEVADGHDARRIVFPDSRQIVRARDPPVANRAHVDPVARRVGAEHRSRHDGRKPGRYSGCEEALARRANERPP